MRRHTHTHTLYFSVHMVHTEPPPADPRSAVGDEWHCSQRSKRVRGAEQEWATSFYCCTALQWCFCHPLALAGLLQVQLSHVIHLSSVIYPSTAVARSAQKKKKKSKNECILVSSLSATALFNKQAKKIHSDIFSAFGTANGYLLCLLEFASFLYWFSSIVIGLNERVTAIWARDSNRAQRIKRRVAVLSSLMLWELLSYIPALWDTATAFLWLRVCMCAHACTPPRTWQEGGKAVTKVLSYVFILLLREVWKAVCLLNFIYTCALRWRLWPVLISNWVFVACWLMSELYFVQAVFLSKSKSSL